MKIMVGYDGSDAAKKALELAQNHARAFKATLFVVTAVTQTPELDLEVIEKAERFLRDAESACREKKIACEKHLLINELEPGESLVSFSNAKKMDEIVLGIRKTSKVGKLLFGSTAQYVILESKCPVATVK
jgi:nucleotide-binding universal stress UspA family protein